MLCNYGVHGLVWHTSRIYVLLCYEKEGGREGGGEREREREREREETKQDREQKANRQGEERVGEAEPEQEI